MDDGLYLNFELGESTTTGKNVSLSTKYKGRWKESALSKKWDRIKAQKQFNNAATLKRPENPPQNTSNNNDEVQSRREKVVESTNSLPSRPLKRKRRDTIASS